MSSRSQRQRPRRSSSFAADRNQNPNSRYLGCWGGESRSMLWPIVRRKLTQLNRVRDLRELAVPPGNRLERLKGNRRGQHSIRINEQYRVCFRWEGSYADEVEVTDYH
ncbi:MAG: type II toxin-antitoxin system RelE/ParE family toxin [Gemmatimonadota bacterium]|nr:type II toxin-antitoxin system RelE/ParE family toxin [Gemmatimonadota bacterium]